VERVYDNIHESPTPTILGKIKASLSLGLFAGVMSALWMILELFMLMFWDWIDPEESIEKAVNFDYARYMNEKESFGDHTFKVN
jgi:beta-glucanase (GH16 family)